MATLAFSVAGQFVGGMIGGPIGATIGRALGALAGSAVDNMIFGEGQDERAGQDVRLQGSSLGGAISRIYGWNRVSGNIIWATELERINAQGAGAKGLDGANENEQIVANFAVAFCEGGVAHLGRIWADGELLDTEGLNIRFYHGDENQLADSLIVAKQGADKAPAYRGVCYLVFDGLPLEQFGNRIPNISVELCRVVGDLENSIKAITVIPGATEFGYDPVPRVRIVSPGNVVGENAHLKGKTSDWVLSIDELVSLCPKLENVAIIVSWFGDDLRCGECKIQPRVEGLDRNIKDTQWVVNGLSRADAPLVSLINGGAAYGGTPSDNALLGAIADLKSRGLKVTLYPLMMMDIAAGNALLDPYTQNVGQPSYPWRGRITCDPAIGVAGTPDKTAAIDVQIDAFVGVANVVDFVAAGETVNYTGVSDWGYRRMVLHYAKLMQIAGGVDAFVIGSEMRQMSFLRRSETQFPFVDALVDLADDVRSIVGAGTKITYAADWSEYSGYQPSDAAGDKHFHLDPLWASPNIDAIGIDNYMPLSDWRDGGDHADAMIANSPHDLDYLKSNIAGGEGFDFYYGSSNDRVAGNRSAISDGVYGEDWVWRYKDLKNWWNNPHHNRINGVREVNPTAWVAQSKPFWFTEVGCGAVDKGSNMPNAFADAKSVENALPYFSNGKSDALQQRQHLRAHHLYWQPDAVGFDVADNPVSSVYGGYMLDPARIYVWTWDARPYPAFPNLLSVWSDGVNHATGHWLTGRLGALGANELIKAIAQDFGVEIVLENSTNVQIDGQQLNNVSTLRNAIAPLLDVADLTIVDRVDNLAIIANGKSSEISVFKDSWVGENKELINRTQPDSSAFIGHLGFSYYQRKNSFLNGTVSAALHKDAKKGFGVAAVNSGLVMNGLNARNAAENALNRLNIASDIVEFSLPLSFIQLEVGDVIDIEGQLNGPFIISELRDGFFRRVSARAVAGQVSVAVIEDEIVANFNGTSVASEPQTILVHLPVSENAVGASRMFVGSYAKPWPAYVMIEDGVTGTEIVRLNQNATIGELVEPISGGVNHLWNYGEKIRVLLYGGYISSASEMAVLAGSNRFAVEHDDGSWEIIGFVEAELIADSTYELSQILRGLNGTKASGDISMGNRVMLLDDKVKAVDVVPEMLGSDFVVRAFAGSSDGVGQEISVSLLLDPELPLAPVHLSSKRDVASGDVSFSWVRRTRLNGNSWALAEVPLDHVPEAYLVQIYDGATLLRSIESSVAEVVYLMADQLLDFGILPVSFDFRVSQISSVYGAGHAGFAQFSA